MNTDTELGLRELEEVFLAARADDREREAWMQEHEARQANRKLLATKATEVTETDAEVEARKLRVAAIKLEIEAEAFAAKEVKRKEDKAALLSFVGFCLLILLFGPVGVLVWLLLKYWHELSAGWTKIKKIADNLAEK